MKNTIYIDLQPSITWKDPLSEVGDDGEPAWTRLLGCVEIAGVPHHLEAWAVETDEEGCQKVLSAFTSYEEITNYMTEGAGQTVTLNGHEYFMVMTPYQQ